MSLKDAAGLGQGQQQQQQQQQNQNAGGQQQQQQPNQNASGANAGQQQQQNNPGGGGPSPSPDGGQAGGSNHPAWRPQGLPDHLAGDTAEATLAKLFPAYEGARKAIGERGEVPKEATGYKFEPTEALKPFAADLESDGLFAKARERAHAAGITNKEFNGFLNGVLSDILETGSMQAVDYGKELKALTPKEAQGLDEAGQKAATAQRMQTNFDWIEGAKASGMPADIADALLARLGDDAIGHRAIEYFRSLSNERKPALNGGQPGGTTEEAVKARLRDPKNDPNKREFDPAFAQETDRLSKQVWG